VDQLRTGDLIIRLDEVDGAIQFLSRRMPLSSGKIGLLHEIRSSSISPNETLEHQIGQVALAFFSANSESTLFDLDRYRQAGADFAAELAGREIIPGDAQHDFESALLLLDRFNETWTLQQLDEIDALLQSAAKRGSADARKYVSEQWSDMRSILAKRISR